MPRIAKFVYAGRDVEVRVRDGYVNISQFCRVEKKRAKDIMRGKEYDKYVAFVADKTQICVTSLIESRQKAGTWAHPVVASWVAERMSSEAAFFIHSTLRDLHLTGVVVELAERHVTRVTPPAEIAKPRDDRHDFSVQAKAEYDRIVEKHYGGACPNCGERAEAWHYDHFWSRTNNLLSAGWKICGRCNLKKTAKLSRSENLSWTKRFLRFQDVVSQSELF